MREFEHSKLLRLLLGNVTMFRGYGEEMTAFLELINDDT
jgi:hypothetical protein